jgi:hypothetical protein
MLVVSLHHRNKKIEIMTTSVKNINYTVGKKVYFSEGIEKKYFRGTIVKNLKVAVRVLNSKNEIETLNKRNLGIVI